eukprot:GHUV01017968.1.p1 GENE.GHUV01017968.1~~GHUV01017968.1.p1  ORF type:complete len:292 (+),score=66.20 GHUV01017968.1:790-1665(+)
MLCEQCVSALLTVAINIRASNCRYRGVSSSPTAITIQPPSAGNQVPNGYAALSLRPCCLVQYVCRPAHALYFAVYEYAKELLGGNRQGYQWLPTAAAGAIATVVNDGFMTPVDVIKQRLQVAHSPYNGVMDCVRKVLRQEGVGALYKSYRTTLLMNIPFTAMHFSVYEGTKKWLLHIDTGDEAAEDRLSVQLVAGGLAGAAAGAITTPLDVVKTRLQTEGVHSPKRYGTTAVVPVLRRIIAEEGLHSIWRGMKPRVLFNCPAAAISWGTYETMKALLLGEDASGHPHHHVH